MRDVLLRVGGAPIGEGRTWAYPAGESLGVYLIPTYRLTAVGTDDAGASVSELYSVFRFGVQSKDGATAKIVGLAEQQTHTIKAWIPTYRVHSARSPENGAWQVYDNFLIHDGPDNESELFATIGCVEIMGPLGFVKFNDMLIRLMAPSGADRDAQLDAIGKSGKLKITYDKASRPALKKAP